MHIFSYFLFRTGCRVTGITLSEEQKKSAEDRVRASGLQDKINFELCDYRVHEHPSGKTHKYDRIVSCEMIEAVGHNYLGEYFFHLSRLLKNDGIAVIQVITIPDNRYEEYRCSSDFIKEQIFPGGCAPSFSAVVNAAANHSDLIVEHAENNCGVSYARTLELWRQRFEANADKIMSLSPAFDEYFIRKWIYYFAYCESGFRTRTLGDFQIVFSRSGNENLGFTPTHIEPPA
jgi:cyclopropane-fatty-acyl-phospholipid synthase